MPTATTPASASAGQNHFPFKPEVKPFSLHSADMLDPSSSSSSGPIRIDGSEHDAALSNSEFLTPAEVISRRCRRVKQLSRIYRHHYWALMEELKLKFREYYWEYGKSPFVEDEENDKRNSTRGDCAPLTAENISNGNLGVNGGGNGNTDVSSRCLVSGCKAKAMALTTFCQMHILSDAKQKLYKPCNFSIKSSPTGPIRCGKPILRSTVPSYCPLHFQKAEKHMVRALKKAGLNVSSTSRLAPKFHVIVAEYVHQIQQKRRDAQRAKLENAAIKEESQS